jgi:hypothetical protein
MRCLSATEMVLAFFTGPRLQVTAVCLFALAACTGGRTLLSLVRYVLGNDYPGDSRHILPSMTAPVSDFPRLWPCKIAQRLEKRWHPHPQLMSSMIRNPLPRHPAPTVRPRGSGRFLFACSLFSLCFFSRSLSHASATRLNVTMLHGGAAALSTGKDRWSLGSRDSEELCLKEVFVDDIRCGWVARVPAPLSERDCILQVPDDHDAISNPQDSLPRICSLDYLVIIARSLRKTTPRCRIPRRAGTCGFHSTSSLPVLSRLRFLARKAESQASLAQTTVRTIANGPRPRSDRPNTAPTYLPTYIHMSHLGPQTRDIPTCESWLVSPACVTRGLPKSPSRRIVWPPWGYLGPGNVLQVPSAALEIMHSSLRSPRFLPLTATPGNPYLLDTLSRYTAAI